MEPTECLPVGFQLAYPPSSVPQLIANFPAVTNGTNKFFEDFGVWKEAPILKGSTKYEPLPDVKNIMITGGAGFM
jgi:hypothetical protein